MREVTSSDSFVKITYIQQGLESRLGPAMTSSKTTEKHGMVHLRQECLPYANILAATTLLLQPVLASHVFQCLDSPRLILDNICLKAWSSELAQVSQMGSDQTPSQVSSHKQSYRILKTPSLPCSSPWSSAPSSACRLSSSLLPRRRSAPVSECDRGQDFHLRSELGMILTVNNRTSISGLNKSVSNSYIIAIWTQWPISIVTEQ